jgi:hypothetical protein
LLRYDHGLHIVFPAVAVKKGVADNSGHDDDGFLRLAVRHGYMAWRSSGFKLPVHLYVPAAYYHDAGNEARRDTFFNTS